MVESSTGETGRVFIVDDDRALRLVLATMLRPLGVEIEMFGSAEAFLAAYDGRGPGCLLLDMKLPGIDGLSLHHRLRASGASLPVVFLTGYADVATARQVLISGASDFLQKPVDQRTLLDAVRDAFRRERETREALAMSARLERLTRREWDVLRLVVAGEPNKLISAELGISQKTVEAHRSRLMAKTQAASVADLVRIMSAFEAQGARAKSL